METQSAYYLGECCTQSRGPWAEKLLPGGLTGKCPHVLHSGHAQKGMSGCVPWQEEKLGQPTLLIRDMHSSWCLCSHSRVFFSRLLELEFQLCGLLLSQCWGSNPGPHMCYHYIAMAGLELTEIHVPLCLLGFRIEGHLYTCYFGYFVCFWDRVSDTFFFPFKFGFTHYILHMYCVLGYVLGLKAKGARHCLPPPAALIAAIAL